MTFETPVTLKGQPIEFSPSSFAYPVIAAGVHYVEARGNNYCIQFVLLGFTGGQLMHFIIDLDHVPVYFKTTSLPLLHWSTRTSVRSH